MPEDFHADTPYADPRSESLTLSESAHILMSASRESLTPAPKKKANNSAAPASAFDTDWLADHDFRPASSSKARGSTSKARLSSVLSTPAAQTRLSTPSSSLSDWQHTLESKVGSSLSSPALASTSGALAFATPKQSNSRTTTIPEEEIRGLDDTAVRTPRPSTGGARKLGGFGTRDDVRLKLSLTICRP